MTERLRLIIDFSFAGFPAIFYLSVKKDANG